MCRFLYPHPWRCINYLLCLAVIFSMCNLIHGVDNTSLAYGNGESKKIFTKLDFFNNILNPKVHNKYAFPLHSADTIEITVSMTLYSLLDIDVDDQTMTSVINTYLLWTTEQVFSDPNECDYDYLYIPEKYIWTPDITIHNKAVPGFSLFHKESLIRMESTGDIDYNAMSQITTVCDIRITYFPFDVQACSIEYTTEFTANWLVKLASGDDEYGSHNALEEYHNDGTWRMLGYRIKEEVIGSDHDLTAKNLFTMTFYVSRRTRFYVVSLLLPVLFLSCASALVFIIPAEAGEKMGTSITVLLAYAVYLTIVTDYLPETSLEISLLSLYLTIILGLCSVTVLLSTWVLHCYHKKDDEPIRPWVRTVINVMRIVSCNRKKKSQTTDQELDNLSGINCEDHQKPVDTEDDMTWQEVAQVQDWFFFLVFMICNALFTFIFAAIIVSGDGNDWTSSDGFIPVPPHLDPW